MGQDIPPGQIGSSLAEKQDPGTELNAHIRWGEKVVKAVYLHIPFCLSKCNYCSFFSVPYSKAEVDKYVENLIIELELAGKEYEIMAKTIYFGGGTPSLLTSEQIKRVIGRITVCDPAEISLEINPIQITEPFLEALSTTKINRLSIGLQSMNDADLLMLTRRHRQDQIKEKILLCRRFGYKNISLDLMYGIPGSDVMHLKENLNRFLELEPEHISAYLLTLDDTKQDNTSQGALGKATPPDDDSLAEQYDALREGLEDAGFAQYEISNFAREGFASRHNLSYWNSEDYLGLGASASGWLRPFRYTNVADLHEYYNSVESAIFMPDCELCDEQRQKEDYLMMGLRLVKGISPRGYFEHFGSSLHDDFGSVLSLPLMQKVLNQSEDSISLKPEYYFVSNRVIAEFIS